MARILYASPHCPLDLASGAGLSTVEILRIFAEAGHECRIVAATCFDAPAPVDPREYLGGFCEAIGGSRGVLELVAEGIPAQVLVTSTQRNRDLPPLDQRLYRSVYERAVDSFAPEVVLLYGGTEAERQVLAAARAAGIRTVFLLLNARYHNPTTFTHVDRIVVPSQASKALYRLRLGLESTVLYPVIDWSKCLAVGPQPETVTFINPDYEKGAVIVHAIIEESRRRGHRFRFLIQESRGTRTMLERDGLRFGDEVEFRPRTEDADLRRVYAVTRVLLCPSLCDDPMPRVVMEAVINGIPVLGNRDGGIPEGMGDSGKLFESPRSLRRDPRATPDPAWIADWVDALEQLMCDEAAYSREQERVLAQRARFRRETVGASYLHFVDELLSEPGG